MKTSDHDSSEPLNPLGSGLVNLLMLVFGLGCLYLAGKGLLSGSIDGGSNAVFTWARKPVKFVLVVLCWTGLGALLLLAGWRGIAPLMGNDSGAAYDKATRFDSLDDAGQHATDGWQHTVQDRLSGVPAAGSNALGTSVSVKAARPERRLSEKAATEHLPDSPTLPEPLQLHVSRPYAWLALVLVSLLAAGLGAGVFALSGAPGGLLAVVVFVPAALVCGIVALQCIRNLSHEGPVLVLDRFGLTNHRKGGHLIAWTEVDAARLHATNSATYLVLRFRHADDMHAHFGLLRLLPSVLGRIFFKGFEGRIKLTSLSFKRAEVQRVAQAFIRHARR